MITMNAAQRELHRRAQERHCAKKENHILELEEQLRLLQQTVPQEPLFQVTECDQCPILNSSLQQSLRTVQALSDTVVSLEAEKQSLLHLLNDDALLEIFAPPPLQGIFSDAQVLRAGLKALPSLHNNPHIDDLIRLRLEFDTLRSDSSKRLQFLKFENTKFTILDACTLLERKRVIELIEWFRSRNRVTVSPVEDSRLAHPTPNALLTSPAMNIRTDISFRENMKRIASLKRVWDVIDYWSDEFHAWKGYTGCRTQRETQDFILRQNDFVRALARMCVGDDLIRFHLALEIGRASNKTLWERHRAKKENHILELEEQLRLLQQTVPQEPLFQVTECDQCPILNSSLQQSLRTVQALSDTVVSLEAEKQSLLLHPMSSEREAEPFIADDALLDLLSSPSLQAIMLDVEVLRVELNALPSLHNSPHIDGLIRLRLEFETFRNDPPKQRLQFLQFENTKFKILDACTLLERKRVIELIQGFRFMHAAVVPAVIDHFNASTCHIACEHRCDLSFAEDIKRIPSLRGAWSLIDQLMEETTSWKGHTGPRTQQETQDFLLRLNEHARGLARLCSWDDLIQFYMSLEVARTKNKQQW
ncbi:hypothetical protein HDU98_002077, partial [Podochytrium sp. JEL0797]